MSPAVRIALIIAVGWPIAIAFILAWFKKWAYHDDDYRVPGWFDHDDSEATDG